ncbi:MAG: carbohydrate-binding protein [Butyrivibrio sp.]|nr:carbohydrate-binding protein [Butyrivibrio sp.]
MKISVYNDWDHVPKAESEGQDNVVLAWDGEYRKGDIIEFSGIEPDNFYVVKVDAAIDPALVYIAQETVLFTVPFYEKKTSYNPLAFFGNRHYVSIRAAFSFEVESYRNIAANPFDQHEVTGVYPHASANVETRGEAVFAARNAIDGCIATLSHGEWPYESWGINRQDDAEFTLDFGREVDFDQIVLYTRADFPHDNWWVEATFTFSDGTSEVVQMDKKVAEPHVFHIERKGITWLKLGKLIKADDPSPFPALTQIEVYGSESAGR